MNKELNYFIGKPITIITNSINRNFNETQSIDYFTGICEKITDQGVFTYHPITKCKNFILFSSMVGIFEEQQTYEDLTTDTTDLNNIKDDDKIYIKENKELNINSLSELIN